jgi:twitching motility protein PilT
MPDLLLRLFHAAETVDASDIHLTRDEPPYLRVGGKLASAKDHPLSEQDILELLRPTLDDSRLRRFEERGYVDFAYETRLVIDGTERAVRYRMHLYRSRGSLTAALRRIKLEIPTFEQLHLPPVYEKAITLRPKGIIIVGGETGSGKSTTMAAMLDYVNSREQKHIVTVEDPIEFIIPNKKCKINQRELGQDFVDFPDALRAIVREDPDVIMIGELRDSETVKAAVAAAETGHLVLTSLHTASAPEALHRILYFFPPHEEHMVRQNLASTLIAIMNQMLLPVVDNQVARLKSKRIPTTEVLVNTSVVKEYLRDPARDQELADLISGDKVGDEAGSHDFNYSLKRLCQRDIIDQETALRSSLRPEQLRMILKGIG